MIPQGSGAQAPILTVTLNPALDLSTSAAEVVPDLKLRCAAPVIDPGGGGINVSRAILRPPRVDNFDDPETLRRTLDD